MVLSKTDQAFLTFYLAKRYILKFLNIQASADLEYCTC